MSEYKIKYLKILRDQYNKGNMCRREYRREVRLVRGQKSIFDLLRNILLKLSY